MRHIVDDVPKALRILDTSQVPPALKATIGEERALQFREILDRIPLPAFDTIPDAAAIATQPIKRWRLPDTEIDFTQVQQGPRTGDYLLSPETSTGCRNTISGSGTCPTGQVRHNG